MRIDTLDVSNFKGFEQRQLKLHPQFTLVVGENGAGKTSVLEALSVAVGSWFLGLRECDTRHIRPADVRMVVFDGEGGGTHGEQQFPCVVEAKGSVCDRTLTWKRTLNSASGRTTYGDARDVKKLSMEADSAVRRGEEFVLPLISYYSTGRLWNVPRDQARVKGSGQLKSSAASSRLEGYRNSVDPRLSVSDLVKWIANESWRAFQNKGQYGATFEVARRALIGSLMDAEDIYFDANYGEVMIRFGDGSRQPFNNLSDGQRCMLALVGDLARKAATLNPRLGAEALRETPGVVLIDELDLHLHPTWQRRVIEDLRSVFPALQFVCTTHSPFLIQSLRSGEELLMLDGQPTANLADMPLEEIARGIQGVENPHVSARYLEMKNVAKSYLETLDEVGGQPEEKLEKYRERLADQIAPYADNPAFQAFLEMKRVAKLGA
ncbi:MAG: AAA family ATPase [Acidobacteriota bacterium]